MSPPAEKLLLGEQSTYGPGAQGCRDLPEPLLLPGTLGTFLALDLFVQITFHSPVGGDGCVNGGSRLTG